MSLFLTATNDCLSSPCENGGQCLDGPGFYICQCLAGWSGFRCTQGMCSPGVGEGTHIGKSYGDVLCFNRTHLFTPISSSGDPHFQVNLQLRGLNSQFRPKRSKVAQIGSEIAQINSKLAQINSKLAQVCVPGILFPFSSVHQVTLFFKPQFRSGAASLKFAWHMCSLETIVTLVYGFVNLVKAHIYFS